MRQYPTHFKLSCEGYHLFRCLFDSDPPSGFIEYYIEVNEHLAKYNNFTDDELRTISLIVERKINATAVEPWLRRKKRRHILTAKLLIIVYWAESISLPNKVFRSGESGKIVVILETLNSIKALLLGGLLKVRYGLV